MKEEGRKSVLNEKEIDFIAGLVAAGEKGAQDRTLLDRERGMLVEQRFEVIWYEWENKRWEKVLDAIKGIPEHLDLNCLMMANFSGKPYVASIARFSVMMLFKNATAYLSAEQVKLVAQVLYRIDPSGSGLGDEPWKGLFLKNAKKSFPDDVEKMIEEAEKAGIEKSEYVSQVLRPMLSHILHGTNEIDLATTLYKRDDLLANIGKFYGVSNLDWQEQQNLLAAGDILMRGLSGETFSPRYLKRAVEVYRWLRNNKAIDIGDRIKIIETYDLFEFDRVSERAKNRKIRGIAKKLKII